MPELLWGILSVGFLLLVQLVAFAFGYGKLWQHVKEQNGDIREIKADVKDIKKELKDARERVVRVEEMVRK